MVGYTLFPARWLRTSAGGNRGRPRLLSVDVPIQLVERLVEQEDIVELVGECSRELGLRSQRLVGGFEFEVEIGVRHCGVNDE